MNTCLTGAGIVFLDNFAGPGMGGGEVHLMHLVRATLAAEMRVRVVCPEGSQLAVVARDVGAEVTEAAMGAYRVPALVLEVRRILRHSDVRIVHAGGFLTSTVARLAALGTGVRLIETAHIMPSAPLAEGASRLSLLLRSLVDRLTRSQVAVVVPVSNAIGDALVRAGYGREKVHVILNGIDLAALREAAAGPLPFLPPGDGPLVGVLARLEPVKGVDVFVRAAAIIAGERPDVRFLVAGDGSQARSLRELAATSGLGDRITFAHVVPSAAAMLAALDVCVMPSRSEGLPLVALEAAALGIPVVASRVGGLPEAVLDAQTGILVPADDPAAFAGAVLCLLGDTAQARALGDSARKHAEECTVETMTERYLVLYQGLLTSGSTL